MRGALPSATLGPEVSEATEGVDVLLIVLVYFFILVLVCVKPLRSLSCVASDYSSESVVCIGILRPLRLCVR